MTVAVLEPLRYSFGGYLPVIETGFGCLEFFWPNNFNADSWFHAPLVLGRFAGNFRYFQPSEADVFISMLHHKAITPRFLERDGTGTDGEPLSTFHAVF